MEYRQGNRFLLDNFKRWWRKSAQNLG